MIVCWSVKGGSGTTVVAAALALILAQRHEAGARLIDMSGDTPSALGMSEPASEGISEWLSATDHPGADALNNLMLPVSAHLGVIPRGRNPTSSSTACCTTPGESGEIDAARAPALAACHTAS